MPTERRQLKVFLSYASQDEPAVREVYNALKLQAWIDPWLDKTKILPGQDWRLVIEKAVEQADVVIICLSSQLVNKEGFIQREIRYAYEVALEKPEATIFLIPLRLDDCDLPRGLRSFQRVDYFGTGKNTAYSNLLDALKLRYRQKLATEKNDKWQEKAVYVDQAEIKLKERDPKLETAEGVHNKTPGKGKSKKTSSKMDSSIVAALIGVAGTIIVTLITLFANRPPTLPTSTQPMPAPFTLTVTDMPTSTSTSVPAEPTSTPIPATAVTPPTLTVIVPVPLGEDWIAGCISTLWRPYPAEVPVIEKGNGCWKEPVHVFSAENGDLDFLAQRSNAPAEIYGLFAPLPEQGTVTFSVRLRDLTNVDLWMGVFAEPDVNSEGILMIVPAGDVRRRVFVQKDPQNYETIASTSLLPLESGFSISFSFTENSARSTVNPSVFVTNLASVPSSQKWLFLGYKGLRGSYRIDGTFLSFELE